MVKQVIHISLSAILLISTIGITISKHYSGGQLYSIALFGDAESCCEGPCDCCSDEVEYFHLDTDYLQASFTVITAIQEVNLLFTSAFLYASLPTDNQKKSSEKYVDNTSPTYLSNASAFLQVFIC